MTNAYKDEGMRLADDYAQAAAVWFSADTEQDLAFAGDKKATARAALEAHLSKGGVPEGWVAVPRIGTQVSADHPLTVLNPAPTFEVTEVRAELDGNFAVRGENTCWFGIRSIRPASPLPSPAPQEGVAPDGVPPHPEASDGACNSTVGNERANGENT
jgi:hypothetical protein